MSSFFGAIMAPLYWVVSVILVGFHKLFSLVFDPASGAAWALAIIGLTVAIRAMLIPLFVKQIRSSRNMQLLQPRVKELQAKYGHDRERLAQATMALYKETGTNPLASCMPLILQMPIFISLYQLIAQAAKGKGHGVLSDAAARQMSDATLFGVPISASFTKADGNITVQILAAALVVAMTATTFLTQRQLMSKNMPADAMTGQYAQQQKMLLYILPLVFAVGGIAFPIGLLLYWTTSNLWTMGQQFFVIRNSPAPNTEAFRAKEARDAAEAAKKGQKFKTPTTVASEPDVIANEPPKSPTRQQPKRQTRSQRKAQNRPKSGEGSND